MPDSTIPQEHHFLDDRQNLGGMEEQQSKASEADVKIHTYHCICSQLLLATTTPLQSLPTRVSSTDNAFIVQTPDLSSQNEIEGDNSNGKAPIEGDQPFALPMSTISSNKPQIIRRSDGFEKRYPELCGRCTLPIGYHLDWCMFDFSSDGEEGGERSGKRTDVVYLLPGGLVDTEGMLKGGKGIGKLETGRG
ncbi:MAG: hypothetical protein M1820_002804 [Bogoriella megaspora]|nr:MAG: hypothetical protein M1820_002804 [Bogoriella megaspora]